MQQFVEKFVNESSSIYNTFFEILWQRVYKLYERGMELKSDLLWNLIAYWQNNEMVKGLKE